jgi:hypothetical protein
VSSQNWSTSNFEAIKKRSKKGVKRKIHVATKKICFLLILNLLNSKHRKIKRRGNHI